jgi:Tfp pilus assembly protein PilF
MSESLFQQLVRLHRTALIPLNAILVAVLLISTGCQSVREMAKSESPRAEAVTPGRLLATATESRTAEACRRTGLELAQHDRDDHAIEQLEKAREISPRIKGVSHPLAVLYDRQGRFDAAEREYQRALEESPRNADLLNDYGYFLYSRGDLALAEQHLRAAIKSAPEHQKALLNLGLILGRQQKFDEALAVFEKAVGPAAARHNLGLLHTQQGNSAEARRWFAAASRLDPSLTQSREVLAWMESAPETSEATILPASYEQ